MTDKQADTIDDVMAPLMKYLATHDATLGIYPTTLGEFEEGAKAKAALSAMVTEIIGDNPPRSEWWRYNGVGAGEIQAREIARRRAIAKGFDLQQTDPVND